MTESLSQWQARLVALASDAAGDDGAHDINHLHRVWGNARVLMDEHSDANELVVMAACYLHDLVNLPKNHPERSMASRQSAALARIRLAAIAFPPALMEATAHAIETHSFSAAIRPETLEAKIVQDADRLDGLGPIGLARLFYIAGQMGSALAHPDDPLAEHRERDDRTYALDHIEVKLAKLPGMMQTAAGRRMGEARLAELVDFRTRFARHWQGMDD